MQVVPITSTDIKERIHQTYRMGYIKDVILPRVSSTASRRINDSKTSVFLIELNSGLLLLPVAAVGCLVGAVELDLEHLCDRVCLPRL